MMKKFIDWYIARNYKDTYIAKDQLRNLLIRTKEIEAIRMNNIHKIEMEDLKQRLEIEKLAEVEELNAEIARLNAILDDQRHKVQQAQDVYFKAVKKAKGNARISGEMNFQANRLMELVSEIAGQIQGVETRAKLHLEETEKENKDVRIQLEID